jgi:hypothetical protein
VPYAVEVNGKTVVIVPYRNAVSGLNDTGMYRRGIMARDILGAFRDEFQVLYEESASEPKMMTFAMHCQMAFPATGKIFSRCLVCAPDRYCKVDPPELSWTMNFHDYEPRLRTRNMEFPNV